MPGLNDLFRCVEHGHARTVKHQSGTHERPDRQHHCNPETRVKQGDKKQDERTRCQRGPPAADAIKINRWLFFFRGFFITCLANEFAVVVTLLIQALELRVGWQDSCAALVAEIIAASRAVISTGIDFRPACGTLFCITQTLNFVQRNRYRFGGRFCGLHLQLIVTYFTFYPSLFIK